MPAAGVRDGQVAGDGRVHDQHVGLAGDRAAAVVGPVADQRGVEHGDVAVEREDRAAGPVGVLPSIKESITVTSPSSSA